MIVQKQKGLVNGKVGTKRKRIPYAAGGYSGTGGKNIFHQRLS
jgi:hypothetical protein